MNGKLTAKNQTTLPAEVRRQLGLKSGDRLRYVIGDDGTVLIEKDDLDFDSLRGLVKSGVSLTDDELSASIDAAREAAARGDRA
ncbi:MAG: type II toxin-antitoxin system PrlF family antitoxin [Pseudomonadota bacterium]